MSEMRILTVRQPWAWAIIHGGKDVENRTSNIAGGYRGPVAIHAGLTPFEKDNAASRAHAKAHGGEVDTTIAFGGIIGVVDLVGVHDSYLGGCGTGDGPGPIPMCSEWAEPIAKHLTLANPRPLARPIPYRGALGLRRLDEETTAAVWSQLRGGER